MNKRADEPHAISLLSTITDCEKLADFLSRHIKSKNANGDIYNDLRLASEEIFANIVCYAHADNKPHPIYVELSQTENTISITFIDTGIAFNPLLDDNIKIDGKDYSEGGMGIQLIMSLTDKQEYNRIDDRNVFTVTKFYTK